MTQIIGHCRFSWFGISDTGRSIADLDTAHNLLWHPERMAVRFHLFEHIFLPAMRAQTDRDFRLLILISEEMPVVYRDRLEAVTAQDEMIEILSTTEREIGRALRPVMRASVAEAEKAVHFRIDDDDALCADYVARLRNVTERGDLPVGTAISFPSGFVSFIHDGRARHVAHHKSYASAGLAFVAGEAYLRNPFQVQHRKVGQRQASFVDPTFRAFQSTLHAVNNTKGYDLVIHDVRISSPGVDRLLRSNPHIARGAVVDPDLDRQIVACFPLTTGAAMRAALDETLDVKGLMDQKGFM